MNFDDILTQLGEFGLWQKRSSLLLFLPYCGAGINVLIAAFAVMAPRHGYRCRNSCDGQQFDWNMPGYQLSDVFPSFDNTSSSYDPDNPDYCKFYTAINLSQSCNFDHSLPVLKCRSGDDFAYEPFEMESTVATDNNLVCENYFWTIVVDEFYMLGLFIGSLLFGMLSDKIGRRHTLLVSNLVCAGGNLLGCLMPNHWSYGLTRILAAAGGQGMCIVPFTMVLEMVGVNKKVPGLSWVTWSTFLVNIINVAFSFGESLPPMFALALPHWKTYQAAVSSVILVFSLVWFFLPESPRWLIAKGKIDEAKEIIEDAARVNKVKLLDHSFVQSESGTKIEKTVPPVYGFKDMFCKSQIVITMCLFFCWPVITMLFYGLSLSADKIKMTDNVYLSFILVSLIEIPSHIFLPLIIDVVGRKPIFFLTQLIPGICCITAAFLTPGL